MRNRSRSVDSVKREGNETLNRDAARLLGAASVAAVVGAAAYTMWSAGGASPEGSMTAPVTSSASAAASRVSPTGTLQQSRPGAAQFRFGPPVGAPDDLAEVQFVARGGEPTSLADFRGKHVLLNIWATWCGPCREEMPTLDRLQARLGGAGFEVVALSIDRAGIEVVQDFYRELELKSLRAFVDASGAATVQLRVLGLPTTLLLDREGRELGRYIGPATWDSEPVIEALRKLLGESFARAEGVVER